MDPGSSGLDSIQAKQYFLRKSILEEGYDADEFGTFLATIKPDGIDITLWTISELKKVVAKFKAKKDKPIVEPEETEEDIINPEKALPSEFENIPAMQTPHESEFLAQNAHELSLPKETRISQLSQPVVKKLSQMDTDKLKEENFDDISDPYERMMRIVTQYEIKCNLM